MDNFNGKSIKAFLSYSDKDRKLAGELKNELTGFGIEVFLAHEDIPGGKKWEDAIIESIRNCDIFIALLTENFETSAYCNQEVGIAIGNNKKILPIQVDVKPRGFIQKFQSSKKLDKDDVSLFSFEFVKILQSDDSLKNKMLNCLVEKFIESNSYDEAAKRLVLLLAYEKFDEENLNKIVKACLENDQIIHCFKTPNKLKELLNKDSNAKLIKTEYFTKLKELYNL